MTDRMSRRAFLGGTFAILPLAAAQDTTVGRLWQPDLAGQPRPRITSYENDPFVIGVERRLRCTCGCGLDIYTCRTTDFTCQFSPELHREVVGLVEEDRSAEEIVAAFVEKYGEKALMAPPKVGFNWAAYLLPGIVIVLVGLVLGWVLMRRARATAPVPAPAARDQGVAGLSAGEQARLKDELARLES
jgi:cytochrome c-type biogenesis protein CcmH